MKRVAFCTFGCRLNQHDTEIVRTLLEKEGGYRTVSAREQADVYVINTCSVTARADASARKTIKRIHTQRPGARIVVTGCYAQRAPQELSRLPGVDLIVGAADRGRIVAEVNGLGAGQQRVAVSPIAEAKAFFHVPISDMMERTRAFVKVQEGCNDACTFCIIPQTRGKSRSLAPEIVLQQVKLLVDKGFPEVVLTGVHLGDYGIDLSQGRPLLVDLISGILSIGGLRRFRLSSIEPQSVTDDLIALLAADKKFARHLHLPVQSGSNAMLARMKRPYSSEDFGALVGKIAEAVPGCGIGTDVICGFPGETDAHFQETLDRLIDAPITYLHPFTYSVRPGSDAASFEDHVSGETKKRRTRSLKRLSREKNRAFREAHLGREVEVLFEERRSRGESGYSGWTDNYLRVVLPEGNPGTGLRRVRITGLTEDGLVGQPSCSA